MDRRSPRSQRRSQRRPGGISRPAGRQRLLLWITAAVIAAAVATVAVAWGITSYTASAPIQGKPDGDATALSVNDVPVPVRAVVLAMARNRSDVVSSIGGNAADDDYWQTAVKGTTPAERLVSRAEEDVVRLQVQLDIAKHAGVDAPNSYPQILQAWELENGRRAEAIRSGQPVYGPQQLSESDFLDYFTGTLAQATEAALAKKGEFDDSEAGAKRFQQQHADRFPGNFATIRQQVTMAYLEAQYNAAVDKQVRTAHVRSTEMMTTLPRRSCVADGSC